MSEVLRNPFFKDTTTRDRGVKDVDFILNELEKGGYKISDADLDIIPVKGFSDDLRGGLERYVEKAKELKEKEGLKILDLCSGESNLSRDMQGNGVIVVSADYHKSKNEMPENFVQLDANSSLPFASQSFNYCQCIYGLRYLENPLETINELIRVTKPGGHVLVNGVAAMKSLDHKNQEVPFFCRQTSAMQNNELEIYSGDRFGYSDTILIRVNDPSFRFRFTLNEEGSQTVKNSKDMKAYIPGYSGGTVRDIRDLVNFIYVENEDVI
jgi:SAM-dependent methyltransferase